MKVFPFSTQLSVYLSLLLVSLSRKVYADQEPDEQWQPLILQGAVGGEPVQGHSAPSSILDSFIDEGQYHQELQQHVEGAGQCELYKIAFTQDLYFQYIRYKIVMPEMKEFTLCYWAKFTNHSNDHPIFSYAVDGQPKAIFARISNSERSSYFSLSVEGHTFYRLNYPLRLNRWYHTCQSWNGKTGEWQIWVNAERVGRGFYNRLVGHVIPSGGIAISGQEQTQLGGGFMEGKEAPKGAGGMLGEITMFQLYSVALTAGKAHKDHKHHHAHKFDHDGNVITTPAPTTPSNRPTLPSHPLLTAGQLNRGVRINLAGGQPQTVQGQNYDVQYLNGQLVTNLLTQQVVSRRGPPSFQPSQPVAPGQSLLAQPVLPQPILPQSSGSYSSQHLSVGNTPLINSGLTHPSLVNPANVQFIDSSQIDNHALYKRQNAEKSTGEETQPNFGDKIIAKRQTANSKTTKKRELFIAGGTILEDGLIGADQTLSQDLLHGLAGIGDNQPILQQQKQDDEREPAEAEVKAVMTICTGCDEEPFDKALVISWRTVPKKLYSGAYYLPAVQQCRAF